MALVPRAELSWLLLGDRVLVGHQMATSPVRGRPCGHIGMAGSGNFQSLTSGKCSPHRILKYNQLDQASHPSVGRKVGQRQGEGGSLN